MLFDEVLYVYINKSCVFLFAFVGKLKLSNPTSPDKCKQRYRINLVYP